MGSEGVEKLLERVGEDDLVVLPRVDGSELSGNVGRWGHLHVCTRRRPWMQFEVVVEQDGFLPGLRYERDSYLNLKLAPTIKA
jgi:hypothetical protein